MLKAINFEMEIFDQPSAAMQKGKGTMNIDYGI